MKERRRSRREDTSFSKLRREVHDDLRNRGEYESETIRRGIVTAIDWHLEEMGVNREYLAAKLGVSRGRINLLLGDMSTLSPETLGVIAAALDSRFEIRLKPREKREDSS